MGSDLDYSQLELMQARVSFVPDGWAFDYVGKIFAIRNNLRKPISESEREKNTGSYPYYGPTKIQGHIGSYEQDGSYALIGEDGDHFLKFKTQSMTQLVDGKCTVNNHAHIIEGTNKATREWFYYYFMHRDIFSFLSRQGAGRYKLNKASLEKIPLLVPPVAEQKKIAEILSTWDKAITTTEQLLANSQQQKKALMQQLLTGEKRLLDENGARFSDEWEEYLLQDLEEIGWVEMSRGKVISKKDIENNSGTYPIYSSSIKNHGLMGTYGDYMFDEELISWSVDGGGNFFYRPKHKFSVTNVSGYMRLDTTKLNYKFIATQLELLHSRLMFDYQAKAHPSVIRKLYRLLIPCMKEQQKIASVLSSADQEITVLEQKLEYLKQERKALMQQLLTGKKRVKVEPTGH